MATTGNSNGYKISNLEQISSPEDSGENINNDSLFLVSDVESDGNYVSKSLKYSDLVTSIANTLKERANDGSGQCLFEGLDLAGRDYPTPNLFFPDQPLTLTAIDFVQDQNNAGIWFNTRNDLTVPQFDTAVNVRVVLSAQSQLTNNVSPGCGIYIRQKNQSSDWIYVPIKDEQVDNKSWIVCVCDFIAQPGTVFGGFVYNPTNAIGKLCAFYQEPKTLGYNGESGGTDNKIQWLDTSTASVIEDYTQKSGVFQVKTSLALTVAGWWYLEGSTTGTENWFGISQAYISTNAGAGSSNSNLRVHPYIQIPSGLFLRARSDSNVNLARRVTNMDSGTIYLYSTNHAIQSSVTNGIACIFSGDATTETLNFKLAGKGLFTALWRRESNAGTLTQLGEQYNYTTLTNHDGQYGTSTTTPHVLHTYTSGESGTHEAHLGGATTTTRILAFNCQTKRNSMTSISCYSPTILSANCLCGLTSLENVYSNTKTIAELGNACLAGCTSLSDVALTCDSSLKIGSNCLCGDTALKSVDIVAENYVSNAFGNSFAKGCTSLTSVSLPKFNRIIGDLAQTRAPFYGCTNLASLTLSATDLGYLGGYVACDCTSLTSFTLSGGCRCQNTIFDATTKNSLKTLTLNFSTAGTLSGSIISGSTSLTSVYLNDVKIVTVGAFKQNTALKTVTIAGNATFIARQAFLSCTALESIDMTSMSPADVSKKLFGSNCFAGSTKNITIKFPESATPEQITEALTMNIGANSILYVDVNKGSNITRKATIYRGTTQVGTYSWTHTKTESGRSSYSYTYN